MHDEHDVKMQGPIWLLILLVLMLLAGSLMYFGRNRPELVNGQISNSGTPSYNTRTYTVFYETGVFSPTNIRIHLGDSVRFQNNGTAEIRIASELVNGIAEIPGFDSVQNIPADGAFTYVFTQLGAFGYHNTYNKNERGMVI